MPSHSPPLPVCAIACGALAVVVGCRPSKLLEPLADSARDVSCDAVLPQVRALPKAEGIVASGSVRLAEVGSAGGIRPYGLAAAALSRDAKRLYTIGRGALSVWDAASEQRLSVVPLGFPAATRVSAELAVSPDETSVALRVEQDGQRKVARIDLGTGSMQMEPEPPEGLSARSARNILSTFGNDCSVGAVASSDGSRIAVWDDWTQFAMSASGPSSARDPRRCHPSLRLVDSWGRTLWRRDVGSPGARACFEFTGADRYLVTCPGPRTEGLVVYAAVDGEQPAVRDPVIAFSPESATVAVRDPTGSLDVRRFDGAPAGHHAPHAAPLAFAPRQDMSAWVAQDGAIVLRRGERCQLLPLRVDSVLLAIPDFNRVALASDGAYLVAVAGGVERRRTRVWDVFRSQAYEVPGDAPVSLFDSTLAIHDDSVTTTARLVSLATGAVSPAQVPRSLASPGAARAPATFGAAGWRVFATDPRHRDTRAISGDGRIVAEAWPERDSPVAAPDHGTLAVLELSSFAVRRLDLPDAGSTTWIGLSDDGSWLAVAAAERLRIYDAGRLVPVGDVDLSGRPDAVRMAAFEGGRALTAYTFRGDVIAVRW